MAKKENTKTKSVVLHDESINTYGFRMLTSGANLEEFKKNPVMLYNHDDWAMPIGRWENIRIEDDKIIADPVFDLKDAKAAEIARKVEEGFIKAASIGAWSPEEVSHDAALMLAGQDLPTVTKWTVREASFCAIGANHNALVFYDREGKKIDLSDKQTFIRLTDSITKKTENKMNKELLGVLGLKDGASEEEVAAAVKIALADGENAKKELKELQDKVAADEAATKEKQKQEAVALTDAAIRDGRLDASAKDATLKAFDNDFENTKVMLSSIKGRKSVTDRIVEARDRGVVNNSDRFVGSWSDLDKKGLLMQLKDEDPERFKELFRAEFGTEYKD